MNFIHVSDESLDLFAIEEADRVGMSQGDTPMKAPITLFTSGITSQRANKLRSTRRNFKQFSNGSFLRKFWRMLTRILFVNNELHVWQQRDQTGTILWNAYDPMTGKSIVSNSEDEMRSWIETHY